MGSSWRDLSWLWHGSLSEAVEEATVDVLQVALSASASGVSSLGLLAPVVVAQLGGWESARRAHGLLNVIGAAAASSAQRVRLVVSFTKTLRSLGHFLLRIKLD